MAIDPPTFRLIRIKNTTTYIRITQHIPGIAGLVDVLGQLAVDLGLARADVIFAAVQHALQLHGDVVCARL